MSDISTGAEAAAGKIGDDINSGATRVTASANAAGDQLRQDMGQLKQDMAAIQQTLAKFAATAGTEAVKTVQSVGTTISGVASDVAQGAKDQAKTFASELESMARRNPLGTIGGAVLVGIVIGLVSRGRG